MTHDATFQNTDTGVTGLVFRSNLPCGGYAAKLRDDDSGESLPYGVHGITFEAACALARKWAGI